ncbi:hypothetical protein [Novosphingobium sp.]|uniref:hypothetical protein n=1 Tax=Novosphingobium sp. TaxID=1874826 RepID=UPI0038BB284C
MADPALPVEAEIGEQLFGGGRFGGGLLGALRDAGLTIGPREQTTAAALVTRLLAVSAGPVLLANLGPLLAPIHARSPQEREIFDRVFRAQAPGWRPVGGETRTGGNTILPGPEIETAKWWQRAAWVAGLTVFAGLVVWLAVLVQNWNRAPARAAADAPTAAATKLTPEPPQVQPPADTPPASTGSQEVLSRLLNIASKYEYAPTLEEIGQGLAERSDTGWSGEAYAQRLHELTGLPLRTPLPFEDVGDFFPSKNFVRKVERAGSIVEQNNGLTEYEKDLDIKINNTLFRKLLSRTSYSINSGIYEFGNTIAARLPAKTSLSTTKAEALRQAQAALGKPVAPALLERALAVSTDPRIHRVWPDAPWLQHDPPPDAAFAPLWALVLAVGAPVLGGLAWLAMTLRRKKAFLRRRRPKYSPLHTDLIAQAATQIRDNAALFQRAARRLTRRTPQPTDRLDVERTIAATLRGGGVLVQPVFAQTRAAPEYLVLIERRAAGDHEYERLRAMALQLAPLVPLDIYSYQTEPALLEPDRADASGRPGRIEPIDRVMARFPHHRLLILGTGEGFVDWRTRTPVASAEKLMHWPRRALLTPIPLSEWTQDEVNLSQQLTMPIGRATPAGIAALADLLALDGAEDQDLMKPIGDGRARALPDMFRLRPREFFYSEPPASHPVRQVVQDLRNYLDTPGFDWLCALAVYPAIQWDLTLYLGVALAERTGADARLAPLYDEARLAAIAQLPWFRSGDMPNWLRGALIQEMPKAREAEVRAAINALFAAVPREAEGDDNRIRFRIASEPVKDPNDPETLFDDEVLRDFLAQGAPEDFADVRPDHERQQRLPRDLVAQLAGFALALVYAAAAWRVAPKPWDGALITGAWLPLVLLAIGGALALAATDVPGSYAALRRWTERATPYGLLFAGMTGVWAMAALPWSAWPWNTGPWNTGPWNTGWFAPLLFVGGLIVAGWLSHRMAELSGVFTPDAARPWVGHATIAAATLTVGLAALVGFTLASGTVARSALVGVGLGVFALGWLVARTLPERLAPPRKLALDQPSPRLAGARKAALVLAGMAPALVLAGVLDSTSVRVPPLPDAQQVPAEAITATSSDGRYFATGDTTGTVRTFDASAPATPLATIKVEGGGPVVSLAIEGQTDGQLQLAAATLGSPVKFYDGRSGSRTLDTQLQVTGLRPLIALSPDGDWEIAYDDAKGTFVDANDLQAPAAGLPFEGGPAMAFTRVGPKQFALALADGSLALITNFAVSTATLRLPGRARSIVHQGNLVRAIGDDGSILQAEITPQGLTNARLFAPDLRLALGPAVAWNSGPDRAKKAAALMRTCDQLAGDETDPSRPTDAPFIDFDAIVPAQAIPACTAAVQASGRDPRMLFATGRAFDAQKDYVQARNWYLQAAAMGYAAAMYNLGVLYENGQGVPQDYVQARRWYAQAAAKGDAVAMYNLGVLYGNGKGGPEDYAQARRWYALAAAKGDASAMFNLGVLYENGQGVPQDYVQARRWYAQAAAKGDADAMFNLSVLYENGKGVPKDYVQARRWYTQAAAKGDASAMFNLGVLYENGQGVPQDYVQARRWYTKAADAGDTDAKERLAKMPQ